MHGADAVVEQTNGRSFFGSVATTSLILIGGSVVLTPLVGIPLALINAVGDAFGSWSNSYAKDAAMSGRRAMNLIDVQIARNT